MLKPGAEALLVLPNSTRPESSETTLIPTIAAKFRFPQIAEILFVVRKSDFAA